MAKTNDKAAIYIAYGSNLPPVRLNEAHMTASQTFAQLVKDLNDHKITVLKTSRLWSSLAWPDVNDPPYINAVLQIATDLNPADLMTVLHDFERDYGRIRDGRINAPRPLDLDLIAYEDRVETLENGLILPHPRAADRAFVMGPLAEIAPDWVHPVLKQTARALYAAATIGRDACPLPVD
ncbi:MAG: 2-amino-4-hydroxy-6-hydroxymethyldihydropteridine diphosphokinase [Asticcacaulis sp.]